MILDELVKNDTVIVSLPWGRADTLILGETGCGKSTQLAQLLRTHSISLDHFSPSLSSAGKLSRMRRGPNIAVTQPRRLPAIALATRVAAEMGCALGGEVGYSVRFEEATSRSTRVRYMTEGVLMRWVEIWGGG
jgi:HrpA-like RNA helicase